MPRVLYPRAYLTDPSAYITFNLPLTTDTTPSRAKGTATANFTRATVAMEDDSSGGVRTLTSRGSNIARIVTRPDTSGTEWTGYLAEAEATNLVTDSEDYTASSWTLVGCNISNDVVEGPLGASTASSITESGILTFNLPITASGVSNLPADLTINGTTVSPTFIYYGGDANATDWTPLSGTVHGAELVTEPIDFSVWSVSNASVTEATGITTPDGIQAYNLHEDATAAAQHQAYYTTSVLTADVEYEFSVDVKANNRSWLYIYISGPAPSVYYNISTGVVGYNANVTSTSIEDLGDGWYRCSLRCLSDTTAAKTFRLIIGETNADSTFDGLNQDSLYIANASVKLYSYGATLTAAGSGGSFNQGSPFLGTNDDSVNFESTRRWNASGNTFADIANEDFVLEVIFKSPMSKAASLFAKDLATGTGWEVRTDTARRISLYLGDGVGSQGVQTSGGTCNAGTWYHAICFCDRSGSGVWYVNAVQNIPYSITAIDSMAIATSLTIGARTSSGSLPGEQNIAYIAMWKRDNWLDTHLQADIAQERFQRLCGLYPDQSSGEPLWTSYTRATTAYTDKVEYGTESLPEPIDFSDAAWAKGNLTAVEATGITTPDGVQAYTISEDNSAASSHYLFDSISVTAGYSYVYSVDAKAINRNWFRIAVDNPTVVASKASFDITNGVVGTTSNITWAKIESLGDGWFRCSVLLVWEISGSKPFYINLAEADNDTTFDGLDQGSIYLANASVKEYSRKLYKVGAALPRVCYRQEETSGADFKGYLSETAATNLIIDSEDLSTSNWWKSGCTASGEWTTAPDKNLAGSVIFESNDPTFQLDADTNGVSELSQSLTINGATVAPTFVYYGGNANATNWTAEVGETLTAAGSGGSFNQGSPFCGTDDDSVNPEGTRYWQASGNTFADVTTEDMVFEAVVTASALPDARLCNKFSGTTDGFVFYTVTDRPRLTVYDSADADSLSISGAAGSMVTGATYHLLLFYDKSGSAQWYINGVATGDASNVSGISGLTNTGTFTLGAHPAGLFGYDKNIAYLAMWQKDNWLDTHLQATVAKERFARLCGLYPQISNGTANWTSYTRASVAMTDKVEYGTELLPEQIDFSDAAWTKARSSVTEATGITTPDGIQAYNWHEDGTASNTHFIYDGINCVAGNMYELSIDLKANNRTSVNFYMDTAMFPAAVSQYFNLSAGTVGASGAGVFDAGIEDLGNGWYRCWIRSLADVTTDGNIIIYVANGESLTFDGLDQDSLYIANASVKEYDRKLYQMGAGLPRVCYRQEETDGADFKGYLSETAATNLSLYSDDYDQSDWLKAGSTISGTFTTGSAETFNLPMNTNGVDNLPASLTINSITETPVFVYRGGDANATDWDPVGTYGETLTAAGSGGTFNDGSPFLGTNDDSVNPEGTLYWAADNNTFADVTTEDMVVECVFKHTLTDNLRLLGKGNSGVYGVSESTDRIRLYMSDGTLKQVFTDTLIGDTWYHAICFANRDGSCQWYVNGVASGSPVDISAAAGSLTVAEPLVLAGNTGASVIYDSNIAYLAMWKRSDWLDTHLQADVAQERFARLTGFYPSTSSGEPLWTSYTRATTAYTDKVEYGDEELPQPLDLSHAAWTKTELTCSEATGITTPDGIQAYILKENTANGTHAINDSIGSVSSLLVYELSANFKAINRNWAVIQLAGGAFNPNATGYFDLSNGVVGSTSGNIVDYGMKPLGNGWYRCWIHAFSDAAGSAAPYFYIGEADLDVGFTGLDQDSLHIANASVKEYSRKLYKMGAGLPRICYRQEETDGADFKGYLAETAATNLCTDSEDFTAAAWTPTKTTVSGNLEIAPDGTLTADGIYEDTTAASSHYIRDIFTQAASTAYVLSAWCKSSNRDWIRLSISSATDGWASVWFDLSTGTVGNEAGNDDAGIEDWGNGWFRCWMKDTRTTAEASNAYFYLGEANSAVFDGLNQLSLYVWGAQLEASVDYPTSYIYTSGGTAARNADVLYYKGDDGNLGGVGSDLRGEMEIRTLLPNVDYNSTGHLININDGGSNNDRIMLYFTADDTPKVYSAAGGVEQWQFAGSTDIVDGDIHTVRHTWKSNSANLYVDSSNEGTPDTSCTPPDDLDRINIGSSNGGAAQPNGLINNLSINQTWDVSQILAGAYPSSIGLNNDPTFDLPLSSSSLSNLESAMTINGTTVYPTFMYHGKNASATVWNGWGENLTAAGSGGTFNEGTPFTDSDDQSVNPAGTRYWQAAGNNFADVTTEDMVIEAVLRYSGTANRRFANKRSGNSTFDLYDTGGELSIYMYDGATSKTLGTGALSVGSWYHSLLFIDRSGSAQWYVNAIASGSSLDVSALGSITTAAPLIVGSYSGGSNIYDSNIAYLAMWKQSDWLDTHLQADVAQERFQKLCGLYPSTSSGEPLWTSYTRASVAMTDKIEYGAELLPETTDFSDAAWTKTRSSITKALGITTPNGVQAYNLHEDNSATTSHFIHDAPTSVLSQNTVYRISVDAKANNRGWIVIYPVDGSPAYQLGKYFNVSAGAVGSSVGSNASDIIDSGIMSLGDGWYRCWIDILVSVSGIQPIIELIIAEADNDITFDGLDQDSLYIANASVKQYDRKLYKVGAGFPRICYRQEETDGADFYGYLSETAATNICLDSEDQNSTSWLKSGCTISGAWITDVRDTTSGVALFPSIDPTFRLDANISGVGNLPAKLTINNTSVYPTFRYIGGDADGTDWDADTYGETLTAAGSGGSFNQGSPFLGTDDDSVNPDGTQYWQASGNTFADITTEDIVFECVFKWSITDGLRLLNKRSGTGYVVYENSNNIALYADGVPDQVVIQTGNLVDGTWYHAIIFYDASGSAQWYINGVAAGSAGDVSAVGTLTVAAPLILGGDNTSNYDSNIAYLAMWKADNWLDTHLQATVAQERFQKLCGLYPQISSGEPLWTSYTRASVAYTDKVEYGTELLPVPVDFSDAAWAKANSSVTEATGVTTPDGVQAYNLHEDATASSSHYITDATSALTAGVVYKLSVDVKANNRNWVYVYQTTDIAASYFNVDSGAVGTSTGVLDKGIESLGNGWYRCWFRFIAGSTGARSVEIRIAEANSDVTFDGLDQDSLYIANASVKEYSRKLYKVGAGLPRVCYRQEETDGSDFVGYLSETAATNLCTDSEDFTAAAWSKVRCTVSGNLVVAPNGETTADGLYEDATPASSHYVSDSFTQAATTAYVFSVWAKAYNRNWVRLILSSATDGIVRADFNLLTGVASSEIDIDSAGAEDWGNGWYRCWIKDTRTTAEAAAAWIAAGESDNDITFDGLNQLSLYLWGAQVEASVDYPTSYIYTSGGTAARNADVLYYKGDDGNVVNNQRGTMELDILLPDVDLSTVVQVLHINDGGSLVEQVSMAVNTNDAPYSFGRIAASTQWQVQGATDIVDGNSHTLRTTWKTDSAYLYINGSSEGTPDTSCVVPDDLDRINLGSNGASTGQINGLLNSIKIYSSPISTDIEPEHSVSQAIALTNGTSYVFSSWLKGGTEDWARLFVDGELFSTYFDLSTGTLGTESGNDAAGIENWGSGWFRCWMKYTATADATQNHHIFAADADNSITFSGVYDESIYMFGTQVEADVDYPTSYIQTDSSTATRNADALYYKGDDGNVVNNQRGTMECNTLFPNVDNTSDLYIMALNDGGSADDRVALLGRGITDAIYAYQKSSGGNIGSVNNGLTDIFDGDAHALRMTWKTNSLIPYTDSVQDGTEDSLCDPPDDLDRINIGTSQSGANQSNGLINSVKLYSSPLSPTEEPEHLISQRIALTSGTSYVMSSWLKAGTDTWARFLVDGEVFSSYFDLSTGVLGTESGNDDAGIENWGSGWFRCWMKYTATADATQNHCIFAADADNSTTFSGAYVNSLYVFGTQVEASVDYPTSYIETGAATAARNADVLYYKGDDGNVGGIGSNQRGTMECGVLLTNVDTNEAPNFMELDDGGVTTNRICFYGATNDYPYFQSKTDDGTQATVGIADDVFDGDGHTLRGTWKTNNVAMWSDSVAGDVDTECEIPDDLDRIYVGTGTVTSGRQPNGLINQIKLYDTVVDITDNEPEHAVLQPIALTSGTKYVFSSWLKASNRDWARLFVDGDATSCYFDLSTGAEGTAANTTEQGIEDWGAGWFRCWMSWTAGTTTTRNCYIFAAVDDTDTVYSGVFNEAIEVFGAQIEDAVDYPTSYIYTSGATATRNADVLYYKGDDGNVENNQQGTMVVSTLLPNVNNTVTNFLMSLNDGGSTADRLHFYIPSSDVARSSAISDGVAQWDIGGTTNVFDGDTHVIRSTWQSNNAILYVNGTSEGTPDISCVVPNDLDRINISASQSGANQPNGLVKSISLYNTPYEPGAEYTHSTMDATIPLTSGHSYIFSTWAKAAGRNWLRLEVDGEEFYSYFDVSNGDVGTVSGVNVSAATENWGNGWYRCWMKYTANSTASRDHLIYLAEADNDIQFDATNTTAMHLFGTQVEPVAITNLCTDSEDFTQAAWTKSNATVSGNLAIGPDGTLTADGIYEDTTAAASHRILDTFNQAANKTYTLSVWMKAANREWGYIRLYSATDGVSNASFDLTNGVIGVANNEDDTGIEDWGNGWYRCWLKDTRATAEGAQFQIYVAEGDGDVVFDGLNQLSLYVWGAQIESDVAAPSAYVPTSGGTTTNTARNIPSSYIQTSGGISYRYSDILWYQGDDGNIKANGKGTLECKVLAVSAPDSARPLITLSDGHSSADKIELGFTADGFATVTTAATGGNAGSVTGTTNILDGDVHTVRITWKEDRLVLYVDGTEEGVRDTSVDVPDDLDIIAISTGTERMNQPEVLVREVVIYSTEVKP